MFCRNLRTIVRESNTKPPYLYRYTTSKISNNTLKMHNLLYYKVKHGHITSSVIEKEMSKEIREYPTKLYKGGGFLIGYTSVFAALSIGCGTPPASEVVETYTLDAFISLLGGGAGWMFGYITGEYYAAKHFIERNPNMPKFLSKVKKIESDIKEKERADWKEFMNIM